MYLLTEQQAETAGFKLLDLTVGGGSATVYKALHRSTEKTVALKVLNPGGNPLRIQREARALNTLQHPNIATFVAVGEIGSMVYLATQWIEGTSLRHWLDLMTQSEQPLVEVDRVLSITKSLASALTHAHSNGVTHGDINPNNILITHNKEAKIIDFGIGRSACDQTITQTTELAGTPRYLAPELITGDSPSAHSDQYALALIAYEILTGQWPYPEHQSNTATALHHQLYTQPTPIRELRPSLPASMDFVFSRALDKLPDQRFKNIQCFHDALAQETFSGPTVPNKKPTTTRIHTPGIALALVLSIAMIASIWWAGDESTIVVRTLQKASVTTTENVLNENDCNLYGNSEFDDVLEDNFYQDVEYAELAIRVNHPDAESSPILQLGDTERYGSYGIILDITGGQQYSFSADLMFKDYVHKAELVILWLDESWQTIEGEDDKLTIRQIFDGTYQLPDVIAPDIAHYAVPTLYKDASTGIMYADNVIFSAIGQTCQ